MEVTLEELNLLMAAPENEHLEFKEAKQRYDFEELVKYCVALANEGGGKMVLGVTDKKPRVVVGSNAFEDFERTKAGLINRLQLRIEGDVISHPKGRVVVFSVPSRPVGVPIQYKGGFWMRAGEDIVPMTTDQVKRILDEIGKDFSAGICPGASLGDLDQTAIEEFRNRWYRKSRNELLLNKNPEELLADAELIEDSFVTYAALILLGTRQALGKYLSQAEVVFEYRPDEASGPPKKRAEYREGFLLYQDALWSLIDAYNEIQHVQSGFFISDIKTFNEIVVREAILNGVSHRDYTLPESVFIRLTPRTMEIVSPGGFPKGITLDNLLWKQSPRNRRLAEVFAKCGLVERSGQGINLMFEQSIKESKPRPDFSGTDDYQVALAIRGDIQDPQFLRYLEKIGRERVAKFSTRDLLLLDNIHNEEPLPQEFRTRLPYLIDQGIIERHARDKYTLSRRFYEFTGKKGAYTRRVGLDTETNKMLLLKHLVNYPEQGSQLQELNEVLPSLNRGQLRYLLRSLMIDGLAELRGYGRGAFWFPSDKGSQMISSLSQAFVTAAETNNESNNLGGEMGNSEMGNSETEEPLNLFTISENEKES